MNIEKLLDSICKLQELISYEFKSKDNISIAIFHPGLHRNDSDFSKKFEKLEFLGDRVLGLSIADIMYHEFKDDEESDLAIRIAKFASTDFLVNLAKKTGIIECFFVPSSFFISESRTPSSIADMLEAVFGAIFLDSGFITTQKVISNLWKDDIHGVEYKEKDAKTRLQEIAQSESFALPIYRVLKMTGEDHDPVFEIEVTVCGKSSIGFGSSKKNAERDAAKKMLDVLENTKFCEGGFS
jgi:ribonuclease-3